MDSKEHSLRTEYEALQQKLQDPSVYSDTGYPKLAKRQSYLEHVVALFDEKHDLANKFAQAKIVAAEGGELGELANAELEELKATPQQSTSS